LGAVFGGTVGLITPLVMRHAESIPILATFGACAGALQLSWFWLPYAIRAGRGRSTWPLLLTAVARSSATPPCGPCSRSFVRLRLSWGCRTASPSGAVEPRRGTADAGASIVFRVSTLI
jgi:hypothetical protein